MRKIIFTDKTPAYIDLPKYATFESPDYNNTGIACYNDSENSVYVELGQRRVLSDIGDNVEKYRWLRARVDLTKDCNFPTIDLKSLRLTVYYEVVGVTSGKVYSDGSISRTIRPDILQKAYPVDYTYRLRYSEFFHFVDTMKFNIVQDNGMGIRTQPVPTEEVYFKIRRYYISGYTYPMFGKEDEMVFNAIDSTKVPIVEAVHFMIFDSLKPEPRQGENSIYFEEPTFKFDKNTCTATVEFDFGIESFFDISDSGSMESWITPLKPGEEVRTWEDVMNDHTIPPWVPDIPKPPRPPKPHIPPVIHIPIGTDLSKVNSPTYEPKINIPRGPHGEW